MNPVNELGNKLDNTRKVTVDVLKVLCPNYNYGEDVESAKDVFARLVMLTDDVGFALDCALQGLVAHVLDAIAVEASRDDE